MHLREWDYNAGPSGGWVEVEYPDEPIKKFVDYLRVSKQWREDPELVYRRWMQFERELTDVRNAAARPVEVPAADVVIQCSGKTKAGEPCRITHGIQDGLCHIHRPYRPLAAVGS